MSDSKVTQAVGSRGCGVYIHAGTVCPKGARRISPQSPCGALSVYIWGMGVGRWKAKVALLAVGPLLCCLHNMETSVSLA